MKTADLVDQYEESIQVAETIGLSHFGGIGEFAGAIQTIKCFEDNSLIKKTLSEPGEGRVLVVDGAGSRRCALMGDVVASLAVRHGWRGVIIHGCIRDSAVMKTLSLGVLALGTNPKKSSKYDGGVVAAPISFAGVTFVPGEYVYVDADGIVVSPRKL